jgi:hypothetical protein
VVGRVPPSKLEALSSSPSTANGGKKVNESPGDLQKIVMSVLSPEIVF